MPTSYWSPLATCLPHKHKYTQTLNTHLSSQTHAEMSRHVGYLSGAAGDGDPILTGDVTGAVVGGAGT